MSDNSNEKKDEKKEPEKPVEENDGKSYEYELIGVTVHTGTADGGHYYAFIRDRYGIIFLFFNNLFLYLAMGTLKSVCSSWFALISRDKYEHTLLRVPIIRMLKI